MELLKRVYNFIQKLFSIKIMTFAVATWALREGLVSEWVWFGCVMIAIGGREITKILANRITLGK